MLGVVFKSIVGFGSKTLFVFLDYNNKSSKTLKPHFFHLSGIHPELPTFEVLSVLESENYSHELLKRSKQCLVLNCFKEGVYLAADRAAYCKRGVSILYKTTIIEESVPKLAETITQDIDFEVIMSNHKSFLVRVYRVGNAHSSYISMDLEVAIGKKIWDKMKGTCKVDIKNPDITFVLLFTQDELLFGEEIYARKKGSFNSRRADRRPYFKPGTLEPRFARLMANLSKANAQNFLLDPFCGPGGIILEGALMNCSVIGLDIDHKAVVKSVDFLKRRKLEDKIKIREEDGLSFSINKYDVVFILYGVNKQEQILDKLSKEMNKNTRIIYRCPTDTEDRIDERIDLASKFKVQGNITSNSLGKVDSYLLLKKEKV